MDRKKSGDVARLVTRGVKTNCRGDIYLSIPNNKETKFQPIFWYPFFGSGLPNYLQDDGNRELLPQPCNKEIVCHAPLLQL